jgi:hypothetical protein
MNAAEEEIWQQLQARLEVVCEDVARWCLALRCLGGRPVSAESLEGVDKVALMRELTLLDYECAELANRLYEAGEGHCWWEGRPA